VNLFQIAYMAGLAGIFYTCRANVAMWVVLGNALATLAICAALDLGAVNSPAATTLYMGVDLLSAAALVTRSGICRAIGATFSITAGLHLLNLAFGVSSGTTFAVLYAANAVQLGVLFVGSLGNSGPRRRSRFSPNSSGMAAPGRDFGMGAFRVGSISGDME
jgi:hypothetical protein